MIALVEPPITSKTLSAFSTEFRLTMRSGVSCDPISLTAAAPVASAARNRSACTAGIAAVPGRIMPSASAIPAMVEAGPITATVPAGGGKPAFDFGNLVVVDFACAVLRPEAAAICACAQPFATVAPGHHRACDQHDGGLPGRHRAHQLRGHGFVAPAHQHDRVHRLSAHH